MVELIPFMLFIMDLRDDGTLTRHPILYDSEESCFQAGRDLVAARVLAEEVGAQQLKVVCERIPPIDEFHELFDKLEQDRKSEN